MKKKAEKRLRGNKNSWQTTGWGTKSEALSHVVTKFPGRRDWATEKHKKVDLCRNLFTTRLCSTSEVVKLLFVDAFQWCRGRWRIMLNLLIKSCMVTSRRVEWNSIRFRVCEVMSGSALLKSNIPSWMAFHSDGICFCSSKLCGNKYSKLSESKATMSERCHKACK